MLQLLAAAGRGILALAMLLLALAHILSALVEWPWDVPTFTEPLIDLGGPTWEREGVLLIGISLFVLARAMARGKRQAWWLSLGLLLVSLVGALITRSDRGVIVMSFSLLALLLAFSPLFSTRSDRRALARGYAALALSLGSIIGGVALDHVVPAGGARGSIVFRQWAFLLLHFLSYLSLGYAILEILRPVRARGRESRRMRQRARELASRYGNRATVHFALGADKRYYWSESGRAVVAYRVTRGVALVLGDPIGPAEEYAPLLRSFLAYCRKQDWPAALYEASSEIVALCRVWKLPAYKIGEEAMIDVEQFTLQGKRGAPVRHAIARAKRAGLTVRCWHGETLPETVFAGMRRISSTWLAQRGGCAQMGFSMGHFPEDWTPDLLTVVALDAQDEVQAFLTWTPLYAGNGWALDNMRRSSETPPGAMEWLIAYSIEWAREQECKRMSLGLAPLAGLGGKRAGLSFFAALWERGANFLHRKGVVLKQYRSLYAFKDKFQPLWEPRYLVIERQQSFPHILFALASVFGGDKRPVIRQRGGKISASDPSCEGQAGDQSQQAERNEHSLPVC